MSRAAVKAAAKRRARARWLEEECARAEAEAVIVVCDGCRFEVVNAEALGTAWAFVFPCVCGSETAVYAVRP